MSFYSYKNCCNTSCNCPGTISPAANCTDGLNERVCVQVKKVYDACMQQSQLSNTDVTIECCTKLGCNCEAQPCNNVQLPVQFQSCRSSSSVGVISDLNIDRLCDRPNYARVRCRVGIPIDILFTDANCQEYIGKGTVTVSKDVLLFIPDDSIVPFSIESLVSAICVTGTYLGDNVFRMTICVTIILKVIAEVEMLVPSYGFCPIPPCEEFAENVCDEFFSLPIFPQQCANSGT